MCTNTECEWASTCFRISAEASSYRQSYLVDPKRECENRKYKYYLKSHIKKSSLDELLSKCDPANRHDEIITDTQGKERQ
jgi:hypothetical protein